MSWDELNKYLEETTSAYTKIENGQSYQLVFRGEPIMEDKVWLEKERRFEDFDPDKHDAKDRRPKAVMNVYNISSQQGEIMRLTMGLFGQLNKQRAKRDINTWVFEVSRSDNRYTLMPDRQITEDEIQVINRCKMKELSGPSF